MYSIYVDDKLLYAPNANLLGYTVISPKLNRELNKSGYLEFRIPPTNPMYSEIHKLTSKIVLKNDDDEIWCGRLLYDKIDMRLNRESYCEGSLSYFVDSVVSPYNVYEPIADYVHRLVDQHNSQVEESKQFQVGKITVVEDKAISRATAQYPNTLDEMQSKLVGYLNCYLVARIQNGINYLDVLGESGERGTQVIEFGKNLLNIENYISAENIFTVIIPLGTKNSETEEYLTVASVNEGKNYIQSDTGIAMFGRITKTVEYDIDNPEELLIKGTEDLSKNILESITLTISALDLHLLDVNVEALKLGNFYRVKSFPHGIDNWFQLTKVTLDLENPRNNSYTFGAMHEGLTTINASQSREFSSEIKKLPTMTDTRSIARSQATQVINDGFGGHVQIYPNEFLVMDTPSKDTAKELWRWNMGGLGFSAEGYDGDFTTAITKDGHFVADFIDTGILTANVMRAGILADVEGKNFWNLQTGEFHMTSETVVEVAGDVMTLGELWNLEASFSRDLIVIPTDAGGNGGDFTRADTTLKVLYGSSDVTASATIELVSQTGLTGTWNSQSKVYKVNSITGDSGEALFRIAYLGSSVDKVVSAMKQKAGTPGATGPTGPTGPTGADGESSFTALISSSNGNMFVNRGVNTTLTARGYYGTSDVSVTSTYSWKKILANGTEDTSWGTKTTRAITLNSADVKDRATFISTVSYQFSGKTVNSEAQITIVDLTDVGSLTTNLSSNHPLSVIYSPEAGTYTPNWGSTNLVITPIIFYNGTQLANNAQGLTISWKVQLGTGSPQNLSSSETVSNGVLTVKANRFSDSVSIVSYICTATYKEPDTGLTITSTEKITYTKVTNAINGEDGDNAVFLLLNTPSGTVFTNQEGNLTITGLLMDGSVDKSSDVSKWEWSKFSNGSYTVVGSNSRTLTVAGSTVDGFASFRCIATYGGQAYTNYISLIDKTDPLQVSVMSSIGEQIVSSNGVGVLYAITYANGVEKDPLKSDRFLTTAPSSGSVGEYFYLIEPAYKRVTLKVRTSSGWVDAPSSDLPKGTYEWSHRDANGNPVSKTGLATAGKVIYIDASLVSKKLSSMCKVTL